MVLSWSYLFGVFHSDFEVWGFGGGGWLCGFGGVSVSVKEGRSIPVITDKEGSFCEVPE